MEFDDHDQVKTDLCALRQLYGLLQTIIIIIIGSDNNIANFTTLDNIRRLLDNKRAIQLLKKLLDDSTQTLISKAYHSDQIQGNVPTKSKPPNLSPQKPSKLAYYPIISTNIDQTSHKLFPLMTTKPNMERSSESDNYDINSISEEIEKAIEKIDSHILSLQNKAEFEGMESPSQLGISYVRGFRVPISMINNNKDHDPIVSAAQTHHHHHHHHGFKVKRDHEIIMGPTLLDHEHDGIITRTSGRRNRGHNYSASDHEPDNDSLSQTETEADSEIIPSEEEAESSENYSIDDDDSSYSTARTSHDDYETKSHEPLPRISRLKRIKNKLGLIFHHHHHHHHHHHDRRWKQLQRMLGDNGKKNKRRNSNNKTRKHHVGESAAVVMVKGGGTNRVKRGGGGGDGGNFRALFGGLMRHVGGRKKAAATAAAALGKKRWRGRGLKIGSYTRKGRVRVGFNKRFSQPPKLKM